MRELLGGVFLAFPSSMMFLREFSGASPSNPPLGAEPPDLCRSSFGGTSAASPAPKLWELSALLTGEVSFLEGKSVYYTREVSVFVVPKI